MKFSGHVILRVNIMLNFNVFSSLQLDLAQIPASSIPKSLKGDQPNARTYIGHVEKDL